MSEPSCHHIHLLDTLITWGGSRSPGSSSWFKHIRHHSGAVTLTFGGQNFLEKKLNYWPLEGVAVTLNWGFSNSWVFPVKLPLGECHKPYKWFINIGSGNGLVPSGNKTWPEPTLTKFFCDHMASFRNKVSNIYICFLSFLSTTTAHIDGIILQGRQGST